MTRRLALLGVAALALAGVALLALAGCGGEPSGEAPTATAGGPAVTAPATSVKAYFFRDSGLVPVTVDVPGTQAVARAALEQLVAAPPAAYDTAIPAGVELDDVAIADGVATARFSSELGDPSRPAQGQIVSTLTQFPTVRGVTIEVDGEAARLQDGAGNELARPATAADYGDLTPDAFIFVRTPPRGATVSSPVRASGTANVFEATFQVEIRSGGKLVGTKTITATSGSGTRGTWAAVLDLPKGDVRLVFFEPSANDGSRLHETEVLLHVR